ncbi:hypothetical protein [Puerhibacterium puerhi]|uniref:hypothetical protein n=1 Tax=Puerhibacterium puerhi TaxID=2692623 RepID=UPI00135BEDC6|nr:hypothetical protein [Puerhibacterium puerhi]
MRQTNRALLAVDALALMFGIAAVVVIVAAVARGSNPALLLVLAAVLPLIVWSIRDGTFEIKLWRALNRSSR